MTTNTSLYDRPMAWLGDRCRQRVFPYASAALSLILLAYYLCRKMLPAETQELVAGYALWPATLMIVLSLRLLREDRPPELRLLVQNAVWVILSRALLGDFKYAFEGESYWAVLFICFFGVGVVLKKRQRDVFLDIVTVVWCGILLTWGIAAIAVVLRGAPLYGIPLFEEGVGIRTEQTLTFVRLFKINRNTSAVFFVPALCLMIRQCVRHKHWGWYIAAGLTVPVFYAAIALQHSRSAYLAAAAALGLILGHLAMRLIEKKNRIAAVVAAVVLSAGFTAALFAGFPLCSDLIAKAAPAPQSELVTGEVEMNAEDVVIYDSRSTFADAVTLTARTNIWKAMVHEFKRSPQKLVLGSKLSGMMKPLYESIGFKASHMHNMLFQQALMAGLPGAFIYLLLLISLSVRIVRCYFRGRTADAVIGIALAGAMLYGVLEPLMSSNKPVLSLIFFLLGGIFVASVSEPGADVEEEPAVTGALKHEDKGRTKDV